MARMFLGAIFLLISACHKDADMSKVPPAEPARSGTSGKTSQEDLYQPLVTIYTGEWTTVINRGGGGHMWFGSTPMGPSCRLGTFDTQAIIRRLKPQLVREQTNTPGLYGAWFATNNKAGEVLWEKSPGPIAEVFELFRLAYKDGKATELITPPRFAELWRKHPPTPVSKPWDAE